MSKGTVRGGLTAVCMGAGLALAMSSLPVGASFTPAGPVTGTASLQAIACPTSARCIAVGTDGNGNGKSAYVDTANGDGTAWSGDLADDSLFSVACATPTDCVAASTDQLARVTVASGAMAPTGKVTPPSTGIVSLDRIACPDPTECFAVGFIGPYEHSKGLVVRTNAVGAVLGNLQEASKSGFGAIACPTTTLCLLAAADLTHPETIQLLSNGHLGAQSALPSTVYVQQLACYKNVACYGILGVRSKGEARTNLLYKLDPTTGAVTSKHVLGATFSADGIACGTATQCIVTGFEGSSPSMIVVSNGVPGVARHLAGTSVSDIACTDANACFAVGQNAQGGLVERV